MGKAKTWEQLLLPPELQLIPRTPHPMTIGDPGWIQLGRTLRELVPRTPCASDIRRIESTMDAVARFSRERVKQGFPEQVELPWP